MRTFLAALAAILAISAHAEPSDAGVAVGKVQGLYVKQADHLYAQARAEDIRAGKEIWADVHFDAPARNVVALVPSGLSVETGDLVEMRLAQKTMQWRMAMIPMPEVNRVVAINAKKDTLAAVLYGSRRAPAVQ